jgi:hypothetical protein
MEVMRYKTTAEFLARAKTWLEKAEAENNLILGIATFFKSYSEQLKIQPYFLTLTQRMIDSGKKPEAGPSPNWHGNLYLPTAFILSSTAPAAHTRSILRKRNGNKTPGRTF